MTERLKNGDNNRCEDPLNTFMPFETNYETVGFTDDKNFYVMNFTTILSFGMDAIKDKVGSPVPYRLLDMSNFIVNGDPPGGGNGTGRDGKKSGKLKYF